MRFDSMVRKANNTLITPTVILFSLTASVAIACSTVVLGEGENSIVAYSYDIAGTGVGLVVANPSGIQRTSIMDGDPAQWTARYNNITFNQLGPGMPTAGMNAAGLIVTLMWNNDVAYPQDGLSNVVNELEFIQRLLDLAGSVEEALLVMEDVRIQGLIPIHFLLSDASGDAAVVAPNGQSYVVHAGDALSVPALTNTSYAELVVGLEGYEGFGGSRALPEHDAATARGSLDRFAAAADAWRSSEPAPGGNEAFVALGRVENEQTRWQIVFDPNAAKIEFQVPGAVSRYEFDMAILDFQCAHYPNALAIESLEGEAASTAFSTVGFGDVIGPLRKVLAGFPRINAIDPNIAEGLTAGLLASASCES